MTSAAPLRARLLLVSIVLSGACGQRSEKAVEAPYGVRDSSGVEIVTAGGPSRPDHFLDYSETLRIKDAGNGEPLFQVSFVRVNARGQVIVADGSRVVRVFEPSGVLARELGRKGEGPGEFRSIIEVFVLGDTIAVNDLRLRRATRFDGRGEVIDVQTTVRDDRLVMLAGLTPAGWVAYLHRRKPVRSGLARDTVQLRHLATTIDAFDRDDAAGPDSGGIAVPTQWIHYMKSGSYRWGPLWTPEPSYGVDAAGRVFTSEGEKYEVDVFDASGQRVRRIRNAHRPVPITKELVERYAEAVESRPLPGAQLPREQPGEASEDSELSRIDIPRGETLPALGRLLVGPDGSLWINRPDLADDPVQLEIYGSATTGYWDVLDARSRYLGTVELPSNFRPGAIRGLTVYGVSVGEDDVESVVAYTVTAHTY